MSVLANLEVATDDFVLGGLLSLDPSILITLESLVATSEAVAPYLRVAGADVETVETVAMEDPYVEDIQQVDNGDDERVLYRVEWISKLGGFIEALVEASGTVLEAEGSDDGWFFRIRFVDADSLSAFYRACTRQEIEVDLVGVHRPIDTECAGRYGLTPEQRETVVQAFESGYFAVPRGITLGELSERSSISDSAVSQRLRRGLSSLISTTILDSSTQRHDFEGRS